MQEIECVPGCRPERQPVIVCVDRDQAARLIEQTLAQDFAASPTPSPEEDDLRSDLDMEGIERLRAVWRYLKRGP